MNLEQRGNLIIRIKAMEKEAAQAGKTLTALCLYSTDQDTQTVKQAANTFNHAFQLVRGTLKRHGVEAFGLKIIEPMKNGYPKFFVMLYSDPKNAEFVQETASHFFCAHGLELKIPKLMNEIPNQSELFVNKRASSSSYLDRVLAWSSIHKIRLNAFFGQTKTAL